MFDVATNEIKEGLIQEILYADDIVLIASSMAELQVNCMTAVTSRTRLGWVKYRDCQDLRCRKIFPLKIKGSVHKSCVRTAMLHGSKTWCLSQNEIGILQRTERPMVRNMCGVKLMDKKLTKDLMQMLDLNETIDQLAKANSVHWYEHVLRKDKNNFLRRALNSKLKWTMKRGKPKKTLQKAVVEQSRKVGLNKSDANNRSRWRLGVNTISSMMGVKPATSVIRRKNWIKKTGYYYHSHLPEPQRKMS